jgi:hypothetical protein
VVERRAESFLFFVSSISHFEADVLSPFMEEMHKVNWLAITVFLRWQYERLYFGWRFRVEKRGIKRVFTA